MRDDELRKYRKDHFAVEITKVCGGSLYEDEKSLSVTHNGIHWISISLIKREAVEVLCALKMWLEDK